VKYFSLIRIHHWIKNAYVFAPLFFGGGMKDISKISSVFFAFIFFGCISSAVYIFNDWKDLEADKQHPKKRKRPLANGDIPLSIAWLIMIVFAAISLLGSFFWSVKLGLVILAYALMNLAYSLFLKRIAILDVTIIALGFLLRVWAGGITSDIVLSHWLIIMIFLLSMFLALAKRRDDLIEIKENHQSTQIRQSQAGYNFEFINIVLSIMTAVLLVGYLMYITSPEVIERLDTPYAYFSFLFVLLGMLRYLQLIYVEKNSGNPTATFWKDRFIQINVLLWLAFFAFMLY